VDDATRLMESHLHSGRFWRSAGAAESCERRGDSRLAEVLPSLRSLRTLLRLHPLLVPPAAVLPAAMFAAFTLTTTFSFMRPDLSSHQRSKQALSGWSQPCRKPANV